MFLVVFRSHKRKGIDYSAYEVQAARMEELARAQPGFLSFKSYTAEDGEVIALSEWQDEASARAWGRVTEHRAAQVDGRQRWYASYTLFACADPRVHSFTAAPEGTLEYLKPEVRRMKVHRYRPADAEFERSPGQDADIFAANLVDQRQGGPITIGYGRYEPNQVLKTDIVVDDVMVVLEGSVSVEADGETFTAGPGEIIHMPKGNTVIIRSHAEGALTAYVTYPHWSEAE